MIRYRKLNEDYDWRTTNAGCVLYLKDMDGENAKITITKGSDSLYRVVLWMPYENEYGTLRLEEEETRDDFEDIESAKAYAEELISDFDLSVR